MRARRFDLASLLLSGSLGLAVAAAACGGPQDRPPGPLSRHFDETFIAQVSLDEKNAVIKAQSDYNVAKMEEQKATADEREAKTMLDVARNELGAARLDEKSAQTRKKAADQSADQTRINDATKEARGAELARRAAEERVHYLDAYRKWLHVLLRYTQENTFWRESQQELAEANLAKAKNIQPKGFKPEDYENQEATRRSRTETAKQKADGVKATAMETRTTWLAIQGEADKTLGKQSSFPDPMAPRQAPEGPKSTGGGGYTLGTQGGAPSDSKVPTADDPTKNAPPAGSGSGDGAGAGSGSSSNP